MRLAPSSRRAADPLIVAGAPLSIMLVAGEPSGDALAAGLATAITARAPAAGVRLFGAGGPQMAGAGVDLILDLTRHSMIGLVEAVTRYRTFKRLFETLLDEAAARRPDGIVCVDFAGFNLRFARAVRTRAAASGGVWSPRIVQFVSPQVWASRPGRAQRMAHDFDLLLTIFPFERQWYADHAPGLRVEFVGHPMLDRHGPPPAAGGEEPRGAPDAPARIALLPGSRTAEVGRHLPVMLGAARVLRGALPRVSFRIVAPDAGLARMAEEQAAGCADVAIQVGHLGEALRDADLAVASTGTVTMECAYFGVPTIAIYKTSWLTYQIGRRIITVRHLAMPNLLAGDTVFPELVQGAATAANIAGEALALLHDAPRRHHIRARLSEIVASLGGPGASDRAAAAIVDLLGGG